MDEYVVEKILGEKRVKKRNGHHETLFLVKWEGWDEPTWEPLRNLTNCQNEIEVFRSQNKPREKENEAQNNHGGQGSSKENEEDEDIDEECKENEDEEYMEDDAEHVSNKRKKLLRMTESEREDWNSDEDEDYEDENESLDLDALEETSAVRSKKADIMRKSRKKASKSKQNDVFLDSDVSDDDEDDYDGEETTDLIVEKGDVDADDAVDEEYEELISDTVAGQHRDLKSDFLRDLAQNGFVPGYYGEDLSKSASTATLYDGDPFVTEEAANIAKSMDPIDLFFFFMPKKLWKKIAEETNRYEEQTREERKRQMRIRLQKTFSRQVAAEKFGETQRQITRFEAILPHEILIMMGLLIARSLCPMKTRLEHHWSSSQHGAVPAGTWSRFMSRQRFRDISRFLHFSDNKNPMARKDRAWKIRPVVDELQQTFQKGLTLGRWIAFDEMVIPSRSSRNKVRIYLKNKPHKYGTKLFAVCCGETNYCVRIEVYCGSRQDKTVVDTMCGPAAVVRNIRAVWPVPSIDRSRMRVVVTDREYTCVALAVRLFAMGFCSIGTVSPSRLGFPRSIVYPFKSVPKRLADQRGLCRLQRCTKFSNLYACSWLDNKPVYFLACGVSTQKTALKRKEKDGSSVEVSCPEFIVSYNNYMNGVDAHDQLRLQRYSVQRSLVSKKYYKSLFFGLFDMALVNAYIVHQQYSKSIGQKPMTHASFRLLLHEQLIKLTEEDFQDTEYSLPPTPNSTSTRLARGSVTTHRLEFTDDKQPCGKVRYRVCKVCSLLQSDNSKPIGKSRAYCIECSTEKSRVFLCDRIRSSSDGNHMTCFQIWHQLWQNGTVQPGNRKIRMRSVGNGRKTSDASTLTSNVSIVFE